ncbi:lamin tail domain-containing protein [Brachybacterium sp. YJGR34]|uniref:lamin tail domain-containing protein n=1 Tax=Brachybacterium sp. YJGR34 TaxID=2059911 RepID=UPI0018E5F903|nr:lamin tail domain-containing protein [Brachybacterium sp. YJGR34]
MRPDAVPCRLAALTGAFVLALPLVGLAVLAPSAPALAADADVRISEVESDDPAGGEDWVELVNTGAEEVDLSGWFLTDDDSRTWTIPAGTVIAPGELLVLDHADAAAGGFDFGLGKDDAARLIAADGTTVIDELAWTEHASTTYIVIDDEVVAAQEPTKGTENSGAYVPPPAPEEHEDADRVRITEVTSREDWVELTNVSDVAVDLTGWYLLDEKDIPAEIPFEIPAGTVLAPGERFVAEGMAFGLGKGDQARLFAPNGVEADVAAWPADSHADPTWQLCGTGDGEHSMSHLPTKGAANACGDVVIHEIASSGDDFVELANLGEEAVDLSGHGILDAQDDHVHTLPEGTVLAPGELLLITGDQLGFGLGGEDAVRLQDPAGAVLGELTWTEHAEASLALCAGEHLVAATATPGEANDCGPDEEPIAETPLPTDGELVVLDAESDHGEDLSGLDLQILPDGDRVLWAVNNDAGQISRLQEGEDGLWAASEGWPAGGKATRFADDTGTPDGEGISVGADGRLYVAAERDNDAKGTSRSTVLAYDPSADGEVLTASSEWDLTALLPATSANGGAEGIEMVPANALAGLGVEIPAAEAYGFVALEDTGDVYALALHTGGEATLLATLESPLDGLMALDHDPSTNTLWAFADEGLGGASVRYDLDAGAEAPEVLARADGIPASLANEGVALEPIEVCTDGVRGAWFADDADTDGHALRGIGLLDASCDAELIAPTPGEEETTDPEEGVIPDDGGPPAVEEDEELATGGRDPVGDDESPAGEDPAGELPAPGDGQDEAAEKEAPSAGDEETPAVQGRGPDGEESPAVGAAPSPEEGSGTGTDDAGTVQVPAGGAQPIVVDDGSVTTGSEDASELARTGVGAEGPAAAALVLLTAGAWLVRRAARR